MEMKQVVSGMLLILFSGLGACNHWTPPEVAPEPSLGEELDLAYQQDRDEWRRIVMEYLAEGQEALPARHLIHAVKDFNQAGPADMCLDAAYQYLYHKAQENRGLENDERGLLRAYMEYVLKHPESQPIYRLKDLCFYIEDEMCDSLS